MDDGHSEDDDVPDLAILHVTVPAAVDDEPPKTLSELRDRLRSTEPAILIRLVGRAGARRLRAGRFTVQDMVVGAAQLGATLESLLTSGARNIL